MLDLSALHAPVRPVGTAMMPNQNQLELFLANTDLTLWHYKQPSAMTKVCQLDDIKTDGDFTVKSNLPRISNFPSERPPTADATMDNRFFAANESDFTIKNANDINQMGGNQQNIYKSRMNEKNRYM